MTKKKAKTGGLFDWFLDFLLRLFKNGPQTRTQRPAHRPVPQRDPASGRWVAADDDEYDYEDDDDDSVEGDKFRTSAQRY